MQAAPTGLSQVLALFVAMHVSRARFHALYFLIFHILEALAWGQGGTYRSGRDCPSHPGVTRDHPNGPQHPEIIQTL